MSQASAQSQSGDINYEKGSSWMTLGIVVAVVIGFALVVSAFTGKGK